VPQAILTNLSFNENSTQYTKDRLAVFMLLDEKSRDLQDTLVRQYLRNPRMSRPLESQLWHAVYGQYWEVARGYHAFVLYIARDASKLQRRIDSADHLARHRTFGSAEMARDTLSACGRKLGCNMICVALPKARASSSAPAGAERRPTAVAKPLTCTS
jgi:hypothetical protein